MACNVEETGEYKVSVEEIEELLDAVIGYRCVGREHQISRLSIRQALLDKACQLEVFPEHSIYTGSWFEGMPWSVCGDVDMMVLETSYPNIVEERFYENEIGTPALIAETDTKNPVYLKLRITNTETLHSASVNNISQQVGCELYANSEKFVQLAGARVPSREIHGPATTGATVPKDPSLGLQDTVPCLKYRGWPRCALGFIHRPKSGPWPSRQCIAKIEHGGCLVVGVGPHDSAEKHLQWRWSFSTAEKTLLHTMSSDVAQAMYFLKTIKSHVFANHSSSEICSYFIKTSCLWMAERLGGTCAGTLGPTQIARRTLAWMIERYREHFMPHYFVPEQNLLYHLSAEESTRIAHRLSEVATNICHVSCEVPEIKSILSELKLFGELDSLFTHPNAKGLLDEIKEQIGGGGALYNRRKQRQVANWLQSYDCTLNLIINYNVVNNKRGIGTLPESIVLPVIEALEEYVDAGLVDVSKDLLYRCLGEIYHGLYCRFLDQPVDNGECPNELYQRAEMYYSRGLATDSPSGCPDKGLTALVHLAKFHYLNGEHEKLDAYLQRIQSKLDDFPKEDLANCLPSFGFEPDDSLSSLPWKRDKILYQKLAGGVPHFAFYVNPVSLVYYLLGRRLFNRLDRLTESLAWEGQKQSNRKIKEALQHIENP